MKRYLVLSILLICTVSAGCVAVPYHDYDYDYYYPSYGSSYYYYPSYYPYYYSPYYPHYYFNYRSYGGHHGYGFGFW